MKYADLKAELGISNSQAVEILLEHYPKISKITLSMATNEKDYGVCLCPEAEDILRRKCNKPRKGFLAWLRKEF